jgi:pimeloyl-ACP methyl ester carboxylesterase
VPAPLYTAPAAEQRIRRWCSDRLAAWPVPHRSQVVPTSLGSTHLLEAGDGETVVVYLPGTTFNAATSLPVLTALASRCAVVCPDLPGQPGLSGSDRPTEETEGYAGWLRALLTHVRAERPGRRLVVAAHSRGAAVALSGPTDVDGLVLVSPAGLVRVRVGLDVLRASLPWLLRPTPARSRAVLKLMCGPDTSPDSTLVEWMTLVARNTRTSGAPGPLPKDVLSRWRGSPLRVLVGEHDCFFPASRVRRSARDRLGVETEVLAGLGHLVTDEAPHLVAERVLLSRPESP